MILLSTAIDASCSGIECPLYLVVGIYVLVSILMCCCCYPGSCACGQHQSDTEDDGCCRCKCTAFRRFQLLGSIGSTLESEMSRSRVKESYPDVTESWNFNNEKKGTGDNDDNDDEDGEDEEEDEYEDVDNFAPLRKRRIKY